MSHIYDSILETIGNTPIVRLKNVTKGSKHQFFAKIEYFNPGGSIKDRVAVAMIEEAEKRGDLKAGGTIVEATSGNTGVGLALAAAVKGYKCIFVMPEKMSEEKRAILRAYGAKVVITPMVDPEHPLSHYSVSQKIAKETPGAFLTNQYHNPDNPQRHYQTTGPEIWKQMDGKVDVVVGGAGTGGTLSGVAKYLKEMNPNIKAICADPIGSILYDLYYHKKIVDPPGSYKVEGVGEDMLPDNVHLNIYDGFERVSDPEAFTMTRRLVAEEGLLVGPSSALALVGAMKAAEKIEKPSNIVVVFPDSGRAYLSKAFNDTWMIENALLKPEEAKNVFNRVVNAADFLAELNK
ncbi:cysteine synthase family protein [Bdellovibrio bacteriovorus]|uniref:Cystathionine beta-synthase n=1 Tax=Bdellovibrio bacteriovorus (strain ATCC 15356 / DSM 50701 / NCIMB 9529 / HD100) TaxID=264462 RepID=Q6MGX3_BDEBA|nr:cysteine synthase family protein [Bdellovibrio bacteriovorus]AHZ85551.1 cystathionine beta-synthase [Bdellovibrio bacteriovorus]BEV70098.1 Putative cystathionine beta-synthase [Bdellovibrio bacteriovorus]CAE81156.1 cystathionine beta-synthase [Bdellovibrio bacteriovorus HD100]